MALNNNAMELGKAAEHLVCADLILSGHRAYLSDQGLPYDVVVDFGGKLLRVQVKSTTKPKNVNASGRAERVAYSFHVRRRGNGGRKRLSDEECDVVALVALDIKAVAYFAQAEMAQTVQLMAPGYEFTGRYSRKMWRPIDQWPFDRAVAKVRNPDADVNEMDMGGLEAFGQRKSLTQWGEEYGVSPQLISQRVTRHGWDSERAISTPARSVVSDKAGQRFGSVVAREVVGKNGSNRVWICDCDCGGTVRFSSNELRDANSCGVCRNKWVSKRWSGREVAA